VLNGLDFAIIGTAMVIIALGFFGGVTKVTAAILSIYFGSIVAAAFYRPVTDAARGHITSMNAATGHLFFFVLLFFAFAMAFTLLISRWLGQLKLPRRIEIIDNVGGAALGVLVSALAVTLAAMLLVVMLQALNQTFGGDRSGSMVGFAHDEIEQSKLVPVFLRMSPAFVRIVSPWFPNGLPPILSERMEV
jgi:uncharacterized membrane protein required for colicin V production